MRSQAFQYQSEHYPPAFRGRVPVAVTMCATVTSDIPGRDWIRAVEGERYAAVCNSHGAVAAVLPDGTLLGIRPGEFEVSEWADADPAVRREAWRQQTTFGARESGRWS